MAIGYRAVLKLGKEAGAVKTAEEQLRSWLMQKRDDSRTTVMTADWDGPGRHVLGAAATLDVVDEPGQNESSQRRLYRFTETNHGGVWPVSVYAMDDRGGKGGVIVIEAGLNGADTSTAMDRVGTPRIVTNILETVPVYDGNTRLHGRPWPIHAHDVDTVVDAICDPDRVGPVNVAASLGFEFDRQWGAIADGLTRFSKGTATTFVVTWNAVDTLNDLLPEHYRIEPGRIRTFLPGVELDNPGNSRRHRILGPVTLHRSLNSKNRVSDRLAKKHAEEARRRLLEFELPAGVGRGINLLRRVEAQLEVDREVEVRIAPVVEAGTPKERYLSWRAEPSLAEDATASSDSRVSSEIESAVAKLLKQWIGADSWTVSDLKQLDEMLLAKTTEAQVAKEQLDQVQQDLQDLEQHLRVARSFQEDLQLELAEAEEDVQRLEQETEVLRKRLVSAGRYQAAHVVIERDPDWSEPGSVEELINRITPGPGSHVALERVVFTGNVDKALEVDKRDGGTGRYANRMWQFVRVLHDFVCCREEGFRGGVHSYLQNSDVNGTRCSEHKHAPTESQAVLERAVWRAERVLPVPFEVHPEGRVLMDAHFKPTSPDKFAPRLHYYDDTEGTGKIYIGYIGRHLTNTKT